MIVKANTKTTNHQRAIRLDLTVDEAVQLEAVLARLNSGLCDGWYDQIADVLEGEDLIASTISYAVDGLSAEWQRATRNMRAGEFYD